MGEYSKSVCENLIKAGILMDDQKGGLRLAPKFKDYQKDHKWEEEELEKLKSVSIKDSTIST